MDMTVEGGGTGGLVISETTILGGGVDSEMGSRIHLAVDDEQSCWR
jgi:hypothetical protein